MPAALERRDKLGRHYPVSVDTARIIARHLAAYADGRTGRQARPTVELLALEAGCCERTVQRALKLLEALGVVVRVVEGRSVMTRAERLWAWRNGSSHRQIAAEFALVVPRDLARVVHRPRPGPVDDVTPPGEAVGKQVCTDRSGFFESEDRRRSGAARRAHPRRRPPATKPATLHAQRLVAGVQRRIGWLSGVSPRRLTSLHRFAAQGWTPLDVQRALDEVLRARSWTVPDHVAQPAGYLAALLRDVDAGDRPGALIEAQLAEQRTARDWAWRIATGRAPECPHGEPAGDQPHPITGVRSCALCRKEHT